MSSENIEDIVEEVTNRLPSLDVEDLKVFKRRASNSFVPRTPETTPDSFRLFQLSPGKLDKSSPTGAISPFISPRDIIVLKESPGRQMMQ